jgi:hypothetical protein
LIIEPNEIHSGKKIETESPENNNELRNSIEENLTQCSSSTLNNTDDESETATSSSYG